MTFPWGKRRNTNGQADTTDSLVGLTTDRGYTEHEHLDEMGLIHMNGRVYDPLVGRMMSADPFIQAPGSLQSYNRYAYVMNNPLNLTDPSGYFSLRSFLKNPFKAFNSHGDRVGGAILGAPFGSRGYHAVFNFLQGSGGYQLKSAVISGLSIFCGYAVAACNGGGQAGLAKAYGASDWDAFNTGGVAALSSGAFQAAGSLGGGSYWAHAAAGCVSAAAGGGNCGRGAVSAVFGKFATNELSIGGSGLQYDVANGAIAITAGGIGSVIAGGNFENGAKTAAYGYLFNQLGNERTGSYKLEPVPDTPEMRAAYNLLQSMADTATANVDATCGWRCNLPWIRGTLIHTEFEALVTNLGSTSGFTPEVSYKGGFRVDRGTLGSSRADVIYGPLAAPTAAYDLKTGWSYMSVGQAKAYGANLPSGTPFAIIRPAGR